MNIKEQFDLIAGEYDVNRRRFIPCFEDFYGTSTRLIAQNIPAPRAVLDLGAGTGLLTSYWYRAFPNARFVLADIALEMLDVARRRFVGVTDRASGATRASGARVELTECDFNERLPDGDFDAVISALAIHHLEHPQKLALFKRIYDKLPEGGIFANYDQFCAGSPKMDAWFDGFWENELLQSGLTARDIELWRERRLLDRECSVESELEMLRTAGFGEVKCVYACHKFAVIAALR